MLGQIQRIPRWEDDPVMEMEEDNDGGGGTLDGRRGGRGGTNN